MREVRNAALSSSSDSGKLQDLVFFDDLLPHLFKEMQRKIWNKFHFNVIVFIVIFWGRKISQLIVFIASAVGHLQPGITCQISVNYRWSGPRFRLLIYGSHFTSRLNVLIWRSQRSGEGKVPCVWHSCPLSHLWNERWGGGEGRNCESFIHSDNENKCPLLHAVTFSTALIS